MVLALKKLRILSFVRKENKNIMSCATYRKKILTQWQQRRGILGMFKNLKNILRTRTTTCHKSLLRMEPVLSIRNPEVSKLRKHLAMRLSEVTALTENSESNEWPSSPYLLY